MGGGSGRRRRSDGCCCCYCCCAAFFIWCAFLAPFRAAFLALHASNERGRIGGGGEEFRSLDERVGYYCTYVSVSIVSARRTGKMSALGLTLFSFVLYYSYNPPPLKKMKQRLDIIGYNSSSTRSTRYDSIMQYLRVSRHMLNLEGPLVRRRIRCRLEGLSSLLSFPERGTPSAVTSALRRAWRSTGCMWCGVGREDWCFS